MTNFNGVNSTNNLVSYLDRGRGTELKYGISINKKLKFERLLKSRLRRGKLKSNILELFVTFAQYFVMM